MALQFVTDQYGTASVTPAKADLTQVWSFTPDTLQIVGTPDSANDGVNKAYAESLITGLDWKNPVDTPMLLGNVEVMGLVGNAAALTIEGLSPTDGDTYVVTTANGVGALTTATVGDVWQYVSAAWVKILTGVGGFVPNGTYMLLSTTVALITPYTDATDDGKRTFFDGTTNTGALVTPTAGDSYVVDGSGSEDEGDIREWSGTAWVQLVAASGGFVPDGTRAILGLTSAAVLISPHTDATDDGKIYSFDGTTNTGVNTSETADSASLLIQDPGHVGVFDNLGYVFEGSVPTGSWIQFTGAGQINAGTGLTKSGNTINAIANADGSIIANANDLQVGFASTVPGLESSDGGVRIAAAASGSGLSGGGGSALAVNPDSTTGGNIQPVTSASNGTGLDVSAIVGTGLEADGSANLRLASQGTGIAGGGGSTLSFDATAADGDGLSGSGAILTVDPDSETGGNIEPANVTANGVGVDISNIAGTGLEADGSANLRLASQGTGIAGGGGSTLSVDTGSTVTFSGETWTHSNGGLLVAGTSFSSTQVPNADWVASQIATGVSWSIPVLHDDQLDDSGDAIRQGIAFFLDENAIATDTFRISDGSTTETWTAVAGAAGANQFSIDTDVDACMTSLAARISTDSTLWDAVIATGLNSINDGSGSSTAGTVIVIYRTVQAASKDDRIYSNGANTTQANWVYVTFDGEVDYTRVTNTELPSSDPAQKEFGPGTITANLSPGEAHVALDSDSQFIWDADGGTWIQISGTGSITAGSGLTKTGNTINAIGNADGSIIANTNDLQVGFASTVPGLESSDGGVRVAAAIAGNGLSGGGGVVLSVDVDSETGGDIQPANLTANGVGVDINAIAGTGLEADGSANLRLASQGTGIAGGGGSTLSFDATAADGNGLSGAGAVLTVDPDSETGGNIQPVNLTANGVGIDINAIAGTGLSADGSANLQLSDDAVTLAKVGWLPQIDKFAGDDVSTTFALSNNITESGFYKMSVATRQGQFLIWDDTPADLSEYRLFDDSGTTKLEIGAALPTGQTMQVLSIY